MHVIQIPLAPFTSGGMFSPPAMVHKCISIYTWINICPSQVENPLKGEAGSVYLTPCRTQQSIMDNDGSDGKAWICVLSNTGWGKNGEGPAELLLWIRQTIGLGWKYTITFDCLHNPGCYIPSNTGHRGSEKQNYVPTRQSYFLTLCSMSVAFPPLMVRVCGMVRVSGRLGSQLHCLHISLSKFFTISELHFLFDKME